jgi:pyridoxamine 5'-phosphate oxidase-like protein
MTEAWLETLSSEECLSLLRANVIGRIGFTVDELPTVLPVNYRLVESQGTTPGAWIALRTRPGNVIDQPSIPVAFEIDGIDPFHRKGWSVLVRGNVHSVDRVAVGRRFDSEPWLTADRDAWLVIEPFEISGRRLHPAQQDWAFDARGYS